MSLDMSKDIDLDTVPEAEPEEPGTPAPKEGEVIIEEPKEPRSLSTIGL